MKAELFYIERKVGRKLAYDLILQKQEENKYDACARYGVHLKGKKIDWAIGSGTTLIKNLYPQILRQMQLDLTNGRAYRYFCFILYDFR